MAAGCPVWIARHSALPLRQPLVTNTVSTRDIDGTPLTTYQADLDGRALRFPLQKMGATGVEIKASSAKR